jgi:N-acetylmuramoyl-L-alanine amidase
MLENIKNHIKRIGIYLCVVLVASYVITPLKALADVDYGFYNANDIQFYDPTVKCADSGGGGGLVSGGNAAKIWCYLLSNGVSKNGAAGLMGNMGRETGGTFEPNLWQHFTCGDKKSNLCGYGLVQWSWQTYKWDTSGSMKTLWEFAGEQFPDSSGKVGTLQTQLDYLLYTLQTGHASLLATLKKPDPTVEDQTYNFFDGYEDSGIGRDSTMNQIGTRYALKAYSQHHNLPCGTTSVTATSATPTATTSTSTTSGGQTVVIIDPGHANSSPPKPQIDPAGLVDINYSNEPTTPEMQNVFDVAKLVQSKLTSDGYKALLTKDNIDSVPTSYERAMFANDNNGDIALSIHTDSGSWHSFGSGGAIYAQKVGGYRVKSSLVNGVITPGTEHVTFTDQAVADKSQQYAEKFLAARSKDENNVAITVNHSFDTRGPTIAKGDLPIVQLESNVPWVYNEAGARPGKTSNPNAGLTDAQKQLYANDLIKGVENSIGPNAHQGGSTDSGGCSSDGGVVQGDIIQTAKSFAWPTYKNPNFTPKQSYVDAVPKYDSPIYSDPSTEAYTYCNLFVATVIRATVDKNYSLYGSSMQLVYMQSHPNLYKQIDPNDKQPGDILVSDTHTYLYAGDQGYPGYNALSASMGSRVPMASTYYPGFTIMRYIGNGQ